MELPKLPVIILVLLVFVACRQKPGTDVQDINSAPKISPDYCALTIPWNIAPLNFSVNEEGKAYYVRITAAEGKPIEIFSKNGVIEIPLNKWKNLLSENKKGKINYEVFVQKEGEWTRFQSYQNTISEAPVDDFLYYRLLFPGYERWSEISIVKRSLASFEEEAVIDNNVVDQNCVNCHAFNQQNTDNFMFHMRGSMGGTYFVQDGELQKINLKTKEMANGAVYPRWHPSGKYVAYASNMVRQTFHAADIKKIEVSDLNSSLILYDMEKNELMDIKPPVDSLMDTYPEWSPDGKFLYFCRFVNSENTDVYDRIKYDLYRYSFDPQTRKFGDAELVFKASAENKSVSFPRISPDGKMLVFTYHDYGCFPIWHKEADLYTVDLETLATRKMNGNSDYTESYHSWASNGKWMVFSSKRGDGLTARPYITFIGEDGTATKPFVLPQKDPAFYNNFEKTYNIPEFANADIHLNPGEIKAVATKDGLQAKWSKN